MIDGDTVDVVIAGVEERVRLIGINTPETHTDTGVPECFGPEAFAFTRSLLPVGTEVRLVRDVVGRDDYDRLLAYVFRRDDGLFVNEAIIGGGYARPLSIAPNTAYAQSLRRGGDGGGGLRSRPLGCLRRVASPLVAPDADTVSGAWSLNERLGYPSDAKLVILSCDDLGSCHAANEGVYQAIRDGAATCTSLMVPAPWARHAAANYDPADDVGVHLTLNAEHSMYRWGPLTHAPSLLSGDGGFPRTIDDLWEHADPEEVDRELRTQIERAMAWGIDVTHLAPHLTAITLRPEFFGIYLDLAVDFRSRSGCRRRSRPSRPGSRSAGSPPRKASCSRITSTTTGGPAAAGACSPRSTRSRPASPRSTSSRRSTRRRSGP